ncbi:MAG TPA: alcohol dehydrogenase catalytic domain-containing protein [Streptosporangiaceae bacterium]|jgi:S-(hydroxymethyl)glutathione dehydrogenase/alcohol dehydrogenase|nr:alcohol dehydrogenase catalytic domain-containing protein [Streptosporangiaceae bacterium]
MTASRLVRAAVLHAAGEPLRLEEVRLAGPGPGELLVRVQAAGVCHSDLHYMTGDLTCPLPVVLGHEGAGIVEETGPGVRGIEPGDAVVFMWRPRCGQCEFCLAGRPALCAAIKVAAAAGGLLDGTSRLTLADGRPAHHLMAVSCFAEYAVVAQESVVKIPAGTPTRIAALTGCAVITGVGAVLNVMGSADPGAGVLVIGAGGVGLAVVMGAAMIGAYPIIAADLSEERLKVARELGATHTITAGQADLPDAVGEIRPGGVQWAFEAVGKPETLVAGARSLRPTGTLVAIGLARAGQTVPLPINELVQRDLRVIGSLYGSANTVVQIPRLLELHEAGRLDLSRIPGPEYRLEQINEAYERLPSQSVGRGLILIGEP